MKQKIAVLGAGGMLGSMVLDVLSCDQDFYVIASVRDMKETKGLPKLKNVKYIELDVENADSNTLKNALSGAKWIVNCIGIIKPYIHDDNPAEVERAVRINSLFPHLLSKALGGSKIIQIATDCVYAGDKGPYKESDPHDARDVYGKTKSIGETYLKNMFNIRCSIVGPEKANHYSLMDWFLTQKKDAQVFGYKNHLWNGVTTLHFAKICRGMIRADLKNFSHLQHIIPADTLSKGEMLKVFARAFDRKDIKITIKNAPEKINRTLTTENRAGNQKIWKLAGYAKIPSIEKMILELADYMKGSQ